MENNRAALYLRLSKEDLNKLKAGDDSASIKNQKLLLMKYAIDQKFNIVKIYSDDDESGLYDDRPGFEKMLSDARMGKFDILIAKSQSRFSRNMEHIEKYLHHDFMLLNIRFIGVADHADTNEAGNKKSRQINSLVNEWYCEDLSESIRSVFKAKMFDGQFLGSSAPYGYRKDPNNHNHLLVDDYAAQVVKRIFHMYLNGYGKGKIATVLSKEGVLIPTLYKQQVLKENYQNKNLLQETKEWSYQTIHTILNNETYIGNLVQNKANKISYKDRKKRSLPREQWIIVPGTHEAVIDKNTWDLVQKLQKNRTRTLCTTATNDMFQGMLYCAECKKAMRRNYERRGKHAFCGYICSTYKTRGKQFCESHSIKISQLTEAVLDSLNEQFQAFSLTEKKEKFFIDMKEKENKSQQIKVEKELQAEINKLSRYKKKTFECMLDGMLKKADFEMYVKEYDDKMKQIQAQLNRMKEDLSKDNSKEKILWEAIKNGTRIEKLDRNLILLLIDRIEVKSDGNIVIYYRFQDPRRNK